MSTLERHTLVAGVAFSICLMASSLTTAEPKAKPRHIPNNDRNVTSTVNESTILQAIVADAKAALDDANTNNDQIASACWTAIHTAAQAKLAASHLPGAGLLYAFQKVRDLTRLNSSPIGTSLILGCAPLVQDARLSMVQFFGNIGAMVLLKGVLL